MCLKKIILSNKNVKIQFQIIIVFIIFDINIRLTYLKKINVMHYKWTYEHVKWTW